MKGWNLCCRINKAFSTYSFKFGILNIVSEFVTEPGSFKLVFYSILTTVFVFGFSSSVNYWIQLWLKTKKSSLKLIISLSKAIVMYTYITSHDTTSRKDVQVFVVTSTEPKFSFVYFREYSRKLALLLWSTVVMIRNYQLRLKHLWWYVLCLGSSRVGHKFEGAGGTFSILQEWDNKVQTLGNVMACAEIALFCIHLQLLASYAWPSSYSTYGLCYAWPTKWHFLFQLHTFYAVVPTWHNIR